MQYFYLLLFIVGAIVVVIAFAVSTAPRRIDNVKWVERHAPYIDRDDIEGTLVYVTRNHPYYGVPIMPTVKLTGYESAEELATHAHAVVVACYEKIGSEKDIRDDNLDTTGLGNMAYIALYHPDWKVRIHVLKRLQSLFERKFGKPLNTLS